MHFKVKWFVRKDFYKLILVTQKEDRSLSDYIQFVKVCAEGGITALQLREKKLKKNQLISLYYALENLLKPFKIPIFINDHIELALELGAQGLHLGQTDGDVLEARKRLGPHKVIGLTVNSHKELLEANALPLNYIGVGAIFPTQNKPDVQTLWGYEGLSRGSSLSQHKVVAIGGINESNAKKVMKAGAHGIAAIGAFHNVKKPLQVAKKLRQLVDQ